MHRPAAARPNPGPLRPLSEDEIQELDELLAQVPAPLQGLSLMALDGFLCGVLLQPRPVPAARWLPLVSDEQGRALPASWMGARRLQELVMRRHDELDAAIQARRWFDPWITDVDESQAPREAVLPWVLGFGCACGVFTALTEGPGSDEPELIEALAQIYQHLDAEDLEEAEALIEEIETLEPPATLEEAVESLVRGCLLLADVSRPVRRPAMRAVRAVRGPQRPAAGAASGPAPGRRPAGRGKPSRR